MDETADLLQLPVTHRRVPALSILFNVNFDSCCITAVEKSSVVCGRYRNAWRAERYCSSSDAIMSDEYILEIFTGLMHLKSPNADGVGRDIEPFCLMINKFLYPFVKIHRKMIERLKSVAEHQLIFTGLATYVEAVAKYVDTEGRLDSCSEVFGPLCVELVAFFSPGKQLTICNVIRD